MDRFGIYGKQILRIWPVIDTLTLRSGTRLAAFCDLPSTAFLGPRSRLKLHQAPSRVGSRRPHIRERSAGPARQSRPKISLIIPVYDGGDDFRQCLASVAEIEPAPDETIVVVDGHHGDSGQLAEAFGARVISTSVPGGPARARNLGARVAHGDILLFVDADVIVPVDAVQKVAAVFRRQPDLAAVFGSYDDAPAAADFLSQYKNLLHHFVHQTACEEASTFWSGCGAIRSDIFHALGGFDESYRQAAIEDIELGYRLKQAGHRIRLCKSLQVTHLKRWDAMSLLRADFFQRALPWTELILRDGNFINDLNLQMSSRVSVAMTYGLLSMLLGAWWWPALLVLAGVLALSLWVLNLGLYHFFWQKRGLRFALWVIPWHWFYYFYSGLAFAVGLARHLLLNSVSPKSKLPRLVSRASRARESRDPP